MSDKMQEIKDDFARGIKEAGQGHGCENLDDEQVLWLIEELEQAQAANQKLLELFQQKIDTLDERIETRKGPNYFDESKQIEKFNIEAYTWEQALALAKKTLIDDISKNVTNSDT